MLEPVSMPLVCPHCAAQMPETAAFCPGCGSSMQVAERVQGKIGALPENVLGSLAYLTFIPAILLLALKPYNKNFFVRFHAIQCLLLSGAVLLIAIAFKLASLLIVLIPIAGPLLVALIFALAGIGALLLWLVLMVKAAQGETFKLPAIGDFAARWAS